MNKILENLLETLKDKTYLLNVLFLPVLYFLICLSITASGPEGPWFFRYERIAIENGEWWRIITSHFTHSTWNHFALNMTGLMILTFMFTEVATFWRWLILAIFCSLFCSFCFLLFVPEMHAYVGMSDILHGFLIAYAMLDFKHFKLGNTVLLAGTIGKVIWEQTPYYVEATGAFIGGRVATESHFFGAISGLILGAVFLFWEYRVQQKTGSEVQAS